MDGYPLGAFGCEIVLRRVRPPTFVAEDRGGVTVLVIVCLMPSPDLPNLHVSDKLEHALAFALLAGSAVQLFERRALFAVGIGLLALGIGIEFAQALFTTTRAMEAADVVAGTVGIVAGLAVALTPLRDVLLRIAGRA